ncbi:cell wall/surface repeat protein [Chitinispirillum alkaliphilum]|nr:cell wall/surface repeat protein [Chitinispirillum alkaliphilum]
MKILLLTFLILGMNCIDELQITNPYDRDFEGEYHLALEENRFTIYHLEAIELPILTGKDEFAIIKPDSSLKEIIDTSVFWAQGDTFITVLVKGTGENSLVGEFTIKGVTPNNRVYTVICTLEVKNPFSLVAPDQVEYMSEYTLTLETDTDIDSTYTIKWSLPDKVQENKGNVLFLADTMKTEDKEITVIISDMNGNQSDILLKTVLSKTTKPRIFVPDTLQIAESSAKIRFEFKSDVKTAQLDSVIYIINDTLYSTKQLSGKNSDTLRIGIEEIDTVRIKSVVKDARGIRSDTSKTVVVANPYKTVTFNTKGGNEIEPIVILHGNSMGEIEEPVKNGYKFDGWYIDDTHENRWDSSDEVLEDITLYAKWNVKSYSISYELYGGNNDSLNPLSYTIERETITLKDASRTGYSFQGWFLEDVFENEVTEIVSGSTGEVKVYAKWGINSYTITFDTRDGEDASQVSVNHGGIVPRPSDPSRLGYEFDGWYRNLESSVKWDFNENQIFGDTTLYANWNVRDYSISYELYGGNNDSLNPLSYTIESETINLSNPSRTGYSFQGWFLEDVFENEVTEIVSGSSGEVKVYAKWDINSYTVTFDTQDGEEVSQVSVNHGSIVSRPSNPSRLGYDFDGWYRNLESSVRWDFNENQIFGDTTLYAKWNVRDYSISYELYGGGNHSQNLETYTIESETIILRNPSRTGYSFQGWFLEKEFENEIKEIVSGSTGDVKIYAKWSINSYTVTFDAQNGEEASQVSVNHGSIVSRPSDPSRLGYDFDGWYRNLESSVRWDFDEDEIVRDTTLYAKWKLRRYSITYELGGGIHDGNPVEYTVKDTFILNDPEKEHYTFEGWYADNRFSEKIVDGIIKGSIGDKEIYAKWRINQYTITFDTRGGTYVDNQYIEHGGMLNIPSDPTKADSMFAGWYRDEDLTIRWVFPSDVITSDTIIYAKWGRVVDADGNVYTTVMIGNQEWTVENLRSTKYADGTSILHIINDQEWTNIAEAAYCWYDNTADSGFREKFGALYNWYVVDPANPYNIAPEGWRVPSDADWKQLRDYLIANEYNWDRTKENNKIGKALASNGQEWAFHGTNGKVGHYQNYNNRSGFTGLPGGYRDWRNGFYHAMSMTGIWWCASEDRTTVSLHFANEMGLLQGGLMRKSTGYSIRLVRDN